jgi:toxin YoeB
MKSVEFTPTAYKQLQEWLKTDEKVYQHIAKLIEAIQVMPFKGIGKPETLKHELKGYWSRRITKEHRLVYKITSASIIVIACKYHY